MFNLVGEFKWVCTFDDADLVKQIRILEHIFDDDALSEFALFDIFLELYDHLRDECVNRIAACSKKQQPTS